MDDDRARRLLTEERARLEELRDRIDDVGDNSQEESLSELSTVDQHPADVGTETFDRSVELSLQEDVEGRLGDVDRALAKLEDGSYGRCETCGAAIPDERLETVPAARLCLEHQAAQERDAATG
jgi:DnaK suppressor protein